MISGEGRLDAQSFGGKIVGEIADRCAAAGKPLHLIVGEEALDGGGPVTVASVAAAGTPEELRRQARTLARQA